MKLYYIPGLNSNGVNNFFSKEFDAEVITYDITKKDFLEDIIEQIDSDIKNNENVKIIGNSFGGWIATKLNLVFDIPVFLINPVAEAEQMKQFVGEQVNFDTGEKYHFSTSIIEYLKYEDEKYKDTIAELNTITIAIGEHDNIVDSSKFLNKYSTLNKIYLENEGHRISDEGKKLIIKTKEFERFIID